MNEQDAAFATTEQFNEFMGALDKITKAKTNGDAFAALAEYRYKLRAELAALRPAAVYGVQNDQGFWVGCWNDRAIAESVCAGQPPSHHCKVVPLAAPPSPCPVELWRTIESAPKDGQRILLAWPDQVAEGFYLDNSRSDVPWEGFRPIGGRWPHGKPTYWQPLPTPPKGAR